MQIFLISPRFSTFLQFLFPLILREGMVNFLQKKSQKRVHCFDSFKSWVRVMVKWGNGFFGDFFGVRLISRGKPKKNPQNTPSVYWILSREICVVQHGLSVNHKPIGVCPPCRSKKNWQKIHFCPQKFSSKKPIFPPKTRLSLSYSPC